MLFAEDIDEWLIVGVDYVLGRAADLSPGSPDLPTVAATVETDSSLPAPGLRPMRHRWAITDWWTKIAEAEP